MSLIQQWKCQDNAASTAVVAAVGNNGTLSGGDNTSTLSVVDGPGTAFPRSLDLDGSADYVDISGASLSFASGSAFSFACWVKYDSVAANEALVGLTGANTSRILAAHIAGVVRLTAADGVDRNFTFSAFSTGTWYHLLITRNTSNAVRAFRDGVESSTGSITVAQTFAPAAFGRANTLYHNGKIDDVRVYNSDESANVAAIMAEKDSATGNRRRRVIIGGGVL